MKRALYTLVLYLVIASACAIFNPPPPPKPTTFAVDVVAVCNGRPVPADTSVFLWNGPFGEEKKANTDGWVRFVLPKTAAKADLLHIQVNDTSECVQKNVEYRPSPLDGTDRVVGGGEFRVTLNLRPEPETSAGERGRLRVDGLRFVREDGSTFQWRGFSDFSLFQRFVRGEDIKSLLDERIAVGANILRVFGMYNGLGIGKVNGLGEFRAQNVPDYHIQLTAFAATLARRGLRIEFVIFADAQDLMPGYSEQQSHLDRVFTAIRDSWNVVIELCNEPFKNGCHISNLVIPSSRPPVASGSLSRNYDYVTIHTERKDEWPRTARALGEVRDDGVDDGEEHYPAVRRPVVADEPMGFAEHNEPGRRTNNADDAAFFAGVAAQMGSGATFHSNDGINSARLGPLQKAAAEAWFAAMKWVPVEAQFAPYHRGAAGGGAWVPFDGPLVHYDLGENGTGALRTYNKHAVGYEWAIAIRPEGSWTARTRRGCVVAEEPRRGFVKLRCP